MQKTTIFALRIRLKKNILLYVIKKETRNSERGKGLEPRR